MFRKIFGLISTTAIITAFGIGSARADHLNVSLQSIDAGARLTSDRLVVIVTGTYICGPADVTPNPTGDFTGISIRVRQASGRVVNQGTGFANAICDAQLRTFEVPATDDLLVPWHGGLARVDASIFMQDCDESFNCHIANASAERQIKISGGAK